MILFQQLIAILTQNKVEFVLIGGLAAVAQGSAYVTADIDICYNRSHQNIENLVQALAPLHPKLRGITESVPFQWDKNTLKQGMNFTLITHLGDIDLLGEVAGLGNYQMVRKESETMKLYGMDISVMTLDGLIKSKKAAGRQKDLEHLKELNALKKMRGSSS